MIVGAPVGGQMQFPHGMQQGRMMGPGPGQGMPPVSGHMMQPGQQAGWQSNQQPNSGMPVSGVVAGAEGPAGMASDPLMHQQLMMLSQQLMHVQQFVGMLQKQLEDKQNTIDRLERAKSDRVMQQSPADEVKDLLKKKETMQHEIVQMEQHKIGLNMHIFTMEQRMRMMPMPQMDNAGAPLPGPGADANIMMNTMGGMPMDPMMQHMMMQQHMMMVCLCMSCACIRNSESLCVHSNIRFLKFLSLGNSNGRAAAEGVDAAALHSDRTLDS